MRTCPYCGSTRIKVERVIGLAPFNIWDEFTCLDCKRRWGKHSKVDKLARAG